MYIYIFIYVYIDIYIHICTVKYTNIHVSNVDISTPTCLWVSSILPVSLVCLKNKSTYILHIQAYHVYYIPYIYILYSILYTKIPMSLVGVVFSSACSIPRDSKPFFTDSTSPLNLWDYWRMKLLVTYNGFVYIYIYVIFFLI